MQNFLYNHIFLVAFPLILNVAHVIIMNDLCRN